MRDPKRVAILISGRGSNMRALVEAREGYEIAVVASNRPEADGLAWARSQGLTTWALSSKGMDKLAFDRELSRVLDASGVGTVALAGFMRILTPWFVKEWQGRILNIHPSLLPKYRGLDTHSRAIAAGDPFSGCSVHLVTEELDAGAVLGQTRVPIEDTDTAQTLEARVLSAEHDLYPAILREFVKR